MQSHRLTFSQTAPRKQLNNEYSQVQRYATTHRKLRNSVLVNALAGKTKQSAPKMTKIQKVDGKRLSVQTLDVGQNTVAIRSLDWDRDRFDIEFGLQNGTTYNSYVIFGDDKTAVVDLSHAKFRGPYLKELQRVLNSRKRKTIDYIIVSHTEPDHSGLVQDVVQKYPDAIVAGSKVAHMFLQGLVNKELNAQIVKGGDVIDLGGGHELEFTIAPNLHWPDTMFTLDRQSGIMFTCDAFGLHYCTDDPYDSSLSEILPHLRFYYDCLMKPNARSVLTALKKIKKWKYSTVAVGHGPILRDNVGSIVGYYDEWSGSMGKWPTSVAVLYSSDYGYSDRFSQTIARGINKSEVNTEMADLVSADPAELREIVQRNAGIVLLAPSSEVPQMAEQVSLVVSSIKPKCKVVITESYGGSDEPVDTLTRSFADAGVELPFDPIRVKEEPTEALYQQLEEVGTDLGQLLLQKETIKKQKSAMNADVAKALGRISSGLYVVTASREGAKSAMIASWVQQASFQPLGLTIAVAKDRAIESLMQVGDYFVLNILEEGNYTHVMKHFLQRFKPGQDRFEGIEYTTSRTCDSPILKDTIAHMQCRVLQRLDTGDHWVTYAEVVDGEVSNLDNITAVHRRKVGSYY